MKYFTKILFHFANDSLYRNSIYLMLSTAVMSFFGFFFWIINARFYSIEQVGIATTLISVVTLISSFSMLGLNSGIIRYLPTSERKNQIINTSFTLVTLASALMASTYLILINIFSPKLLFVRENIFFALLFVSFIIFNSLNILSENVFIAYRSSKYVLIKNAVSSLVKLALPIFLISLGTYGIFASVGIATVVALVLSIIFLIAKFSYLIRPVISRDVVNRMTKFSFGNYIAGLIGVLPASILPIMILNNLGAKFSAFFYIDMMIVNLLYVIPAAVAQSLFAEGSSSQILLNTEIKKAIKLISIILFPASIIIIIFGNNILLFFGKSFSVEGFRFLQIMTLSLIIGTVNYICSAILRIKNKNKEIILASIINASLTLGIGYLLISYGLIGIAVGWITGEIVIAVYYIIIILHSKL